MGRTLDKTVLIALGLVVVLLIGNGVLAYRNTKQLDEDARRVAHTHAVLDMTGDVLQALVDAETGVRGFVITGDDDFLEPYRDALAHLDERVAALKDQKTAQHARLAQLEPMIAAQMDLLTQSIELRRKSEKDAQMLVASKEGKEQMDAIRRLIAAMERQEHDLLHNREQQTHTAYVTAVTTSLIAAGLGLAMVAAFFVLLQRSLSARQSAATIIYEQREWFRTTLTSIGDAVIATDTNGRVAFVNLVAQSLTGWKEEEARGQLLETVFRIVNEKTRQPVENPVQRVLREGGLVGLANHTILISRRGRERPIDDSAAPIRDEHGGIAGVVLVFRDVTERRRQVDELAQVHRRLEESFALLDALMTKAPVGLVFLDKELRYVRVNENLAAINGQPIEAHIGHRVEEVLPALWPTLRPLLRQVLDESKPILNLEVRGARPGRPDETGHWLVSHFPIAAGSTILGIGGVVVDVTQQKQAEEALKDADRRKDEFLAMLAHELRNPLAPIRNALEIIRVSPDPAASAQAQAVMERQVRQMVRLVDDLLDVNRISQGRIELHRERLDAAQIIADAVETSRPLIDAAGHQLLVTLPPQPLYVQGDCTRLAQVIANLLNNAAKYTPPGGHIRLTAECEGDHAAIRVHDDGMGIPADMLPKIFEMFTQVDRTLERAQGGLGIGLSLARRLVAMHGGTITAASAGVNQGSTFTVRLPLLKDEGGRMNDEKQGVSDSSFILPSSAFSQRRILVVDDSSDAAESLAVLLRLAGYEVRTAYDGPRAVDAAVAFQPNVALLDIGLPGLNGYEVARRIRAMPELRDTVLIAQTGWGQDADRRLSEDAGFRHHLVKPVDLAELQRLLASLAK
jgi:PAS domain S-box-containing protein